jgi:hapalindole H/12-epi-hapalindole U/12-epi-fischerindole U synthase
MDSLIARNLPAPTRMHGMRIRMAFTAAVVGLAVNYCAAAPVAVTNAGFEAPYLGGNLPPQYAGDVPATAFPVGAAPAGWQPFGAVGGNAFIGVLNPGVQAVQPLATYFPGGAPEGDNVALTFYDGHAGGLEFGIEQTLGATLAANTVYTLTVEIGNIATGVSVVQPYASFGNFDLRGFPGYRVELTAGGAAIATDADTLSPGEGLFELSTVRLVVGDDHARLGQSLGIRLVNLNQQDVNDQVVDLEVDFDDVQLDASPRATADFNGDGHVDASDLDVWQNSFAVSQLGDADGDNDTDGIDLLLWQRQVSSQQAVAALVTVPELGSMAMGMLALGAILAARLRQRA